MYYFCTYFDRNYVYRGLALYHSLARHTPRFFLWVLCLDDITYELLNKMRLVSVQTIRLADFEEAHPELIATKSDRTPVEYYWTMTPLLPLYILNMQPEVDLITYLDADLFFYDSPKVIYDELGNGSVYIIPHRFGPQDRERQELENGKNNVGYLTFRRDEQGLACLKWWKERCLEWCYFRVEPGCLGDQKYLDDWPMRFRGVVVSQNHGVGVGSWNLTNYRVHVQDGRVYLDTHLLIMAHHNAVDILSDRFFRGQRGWAYSPVFRPYAGELHRAIQSVHAVKPAFNFCCTQLPRWRWIVGWIQGYVFSI